jgi:hypothetical protein
VNTHEDSGFHAPGNMAGGLEDSEDRSGCQETDTEANAHGFLECPRQNKWHRQDGQKRQKTGSKERIKPLPDHHGGGGDLYIGGKPFLWLGILGVESEPMALGQIPGIAKGDVGIIEDLVLEFRDVASQ